MSRFFLRILRRYSVIAENASDISARTAPTAAGTLSNVSPGRSTLLKCDCISFGQRQIVKDFFIKFTRNLQKRCQKHRMAPDTSFDRLHFSVQQVFAEIRIVWQLVDIWLPAPLDFG